MGTPPQPPPPGQQQGYGAPQQQGTPGMAIAAMVLGILGILLAWTLWGVVLPILAVIFGILGRRQAQERGGQGSGMAMAGLIMGIIGIVEFLAVLVVVVLLADDVNDELEDLTFETTGTDPFDINGVVVGLWLLRDRLMRPVRAIRG